MAKPSNKKKLTKKQKSARKAQRTKKDKALAARARGLKAHGKRPSKQESAALKRMEKKSKAVKHAAKKGKGKGGKHGKGKHGKKKNPVAAAGAGEMTKAQREKAAKKGAKTRKKNEAKKKAAAKKGAATRKREAAHKGKGKGGGKKKSGGGHHKGSPQELYERTLRTEQRCQMRIAKLKREGQAAIGREKERKQKELAKLEAQKQRLEQRIRTERAAAEEYKRGKRAGAHHGGKKKNPLPNPLFNPIEGWGQGVAAGFGGVMGALATVGGDRFFSTSPLTGSSGSFVDAPAAGDVYNVSGPSTPIWSQIKSRGWKRILWAVLNIGIPLAVADKVDAANHGAAKSFLELWGYVSLGATAVKIVVDVGAKALSGTAFGMRTFAAESTARSLQSTAANTQLPSASAVAGQGYQPSLTGYGAAKRDVGSGCGCGKTCGCKATTLGAQPPCDGMPSGTPAGNPPASDGGGGNGGGTTPSTGPRKPVARNPNPPPSLTVASPGAPSPTGAQGNVVDIASRGAGGGRKNIMGAAGAPRKWL